MKIYSLICIIAFLAGFTQGLSGFGSVLLSLPLLALFVDIKDVIPLVALFAIVLTTILLIHMWKHVEWKKVYPLLIGAIFGIPVGVFFLKKMDKGILQLAIGVILIFFTSYSLFFKSPHRFISEKWGIFFGFLSGCLGGAITAAGPPVIVYTSLQAWSKDTIKATLQGFFFFSGLAVVLAHAVGGITTSLVIHYFVISLPFLVLGTYTGSFFYGMIAEESYRRIILILLFALGILMIYRSVIM